MSDEFGPVHRNGNIVRGGGSGGGGGGDALLLLLFFFLTLVTGPRRSLLLKLIDTTVYEPQIRARLGTTAYLCRALPPWEPA